MIGKSHYRVRGVNCGKCDRVHTWYKYRVWRDGKQVKEEYIGKCDQFGNTAFTGQKARHRAEETSWQEDFANWQQEHHRRRQQQSPYAILGVTSTATTAEIKTAYRKLVKQYHPDQNPHVDPRIIIAINTAYQTLMK